MALNNGLQTENDIAFIKQLVEANNLDVYGNQMELGAETRRLLQQRNNETAQVLLRDVSLSNDADLGKFVANVVIE